MMDDNEKWYREYRKASAKIGDKMRCIISDSPCGIGDTGTITEIIDEEYIRIEITMCQKRNAFEGSAIRMYTRKWEHV